MCDVDKVVVAIVLQSGALTLAPPWLRGLVGGRGLEILAFGPQIFLNK